MERESKRDKINIMKNRIHSSRIYRMNNIQKKKKRYLQNAKNIKKR